MSYNVKVLADSVSPSGKRITTFELTYPRFVHAELMTHRLFSRNSASSRAIPVKKMLEAIRRDPVEPVHWGKNQGGMQAEEELDGWRRDFARWVWLAARRLALLVAWLLMKVGVHKQLANRITEPWMFITVILTTTELENWFKLRDSPQAQPEIAKLARLMRVMLDKSQPRQLKVGEWHLPMITDADRAQAARESRENFPKDRSDVRRKQWAELRLKFVSVGRCARVSYLTHDGQRDLDADVELAERKLMKSKHWSPFEHVAQALKDPNQRCGNFLGWRQFRADVDEEFVKIRCPECKHIF